MSKQVMISMGDFRQLEKTYKMLDKVYYRLEHLSESVDDEDVSKGFNVVFKELENCITALGNAIK